MTYSKDIRFFGRDRRVECDGKCDKAWGINTRPREQLSDNPDDYAWLADSELGIAPEDPGTYEGMDAKPIGASSGDDMNRWCVRECERCVMTKPDGTPMSMFTNVPEARDFSQRIYNITRRPEAT